MYRDNQQLINNKLNKIISSLGDGQEIMLVHANFPIPHDAQVIDLAIVIGLPKFLDVFANLYRVLATKKIILASELFDYNSNLLNDFLKIIPQARNSHDAFASRNISFIPHQEILEKSKTIKYFIRTGEFDLFANAILIAGF